MEYFSCLIPSRYPHPAALKKTQKAMLLSLKSSVAVEKQCSDAWMHATPFEMLEAATMALC